MKKIEINKDNCLGCGQCAFLDEEHFEFGDGRFPTVKNSENLTSNDLQNAICSCPTSAINIIECECDEKQDCECDSDCSCSACSCGDNCSCNSECSCGCK